ncbi:MAG TPA: hypothetical protein VJ974_05220 [Geopsychrobacteraceae bacterium]|nr:hypothetical protein [Geopsychrobacteraceae bacterium]
MLVFDVNGAPPTRQDIQQEQLRLKKLRKQALRSGLISDALHALILFSLYFADILTGTGFLIAVLCGTVIAVVLATGTRTTLVLSDRFSLLLIILGTGGAVAGILIGYFGEGLTSGLVAGVAASSIVATGCILGRKIMGILTAIESLEPINEDHPVHRELITLCRQYEVLEHYRQQARDNLRLFLVYGELKAMRQWVADHQ